MTSDGALLTGRNLANYDSAWSAVEYTREDGLRPTEQELIAEFFPKPPASVLDLGCGAGRTTIGLARAGFHPIAIDLSPGLLALARERYPTLDFRQMDATALAFDDASFDAALFSYNGLDCIYPLASRRRCIDGVWRVLRPGGVFVLSSHNAVGALFSGGYFYPRGYLNALRTLAMQRTNPYLREWYFKYEDPGGAQYLYSAPPEATIGQLSTSGFVVVDVRGSSGERRPGRVARREQHVQFVARKPL